MFSPDTLHLLGVQDVGKVVGVTSLWAVGVVLAVVATVLPVHLKDIGPYLQGAHHNSFLNDAFLTILITNGRLFNGSSR